MSGFAYLNGYPDQEPLLPPTGLADGIAAMFSTMAVAFALYNRDANGGTGQYIDTSLIEPIFSLIGPQPLRYQQLDEIETRSGNRSTSSAPRNVYQTGDGRAVAISASAQPIAMRVFDAIERPDLKTIPASRTTKSGWRTSRRSTRPSRLDGRPHPRGGHRPFRGVRGDDRPDLQRRRYPRRRALPGPRRGRGGPGRPARRRCGPEHRAPLLGDAGEITHLGPQLGAHNEAVYGERLSYDDETLAELDSEGVI